MISKLVSKIRYSYDDSDLHGLEESGGVVPVNSRAVRSDLLASGIKINQELFPQLSAMIHEASEMLGIGEDLDCFVMADPAMQAYCVPHSDSNSSSFSVVMTSGLIERLTTEELKFVVGHEVGHHLYEHWRYPSNSDDDGLGVRLSKLKLSRCAEISADRVGMICSSSLESSCSAMIKIAAGLGAPHISPDISSILKQYRDLSANGGSAQIMWSTHPVVPLRVRALMQFDTIYRKVVIRGEFSAEDLLRVDELVEKDFDRLTSKEKNSVDSRSIEEIRIWGLVYLICADGVVTKSEQALLMETFGESIFEKIMTFLKSQDGDVIQAVERRLNQACERIQLVALSERKEILREFHKLCEEAGIIDGPIDSALVKLEGLLC